MKRIRAISFAFAALAGVAAGLPLTIHADDTEIYVGNSSFSDDVTPNVVLILDTSGSMTSLDGGSVTRMDRVKTALNAILDEVTNVNIGLARYHDRGGPMLFPVSDLNSDVNDVEAGIIPEINQRLTGADNDAEELNASGAVILDSGQLEMTETLAHGVEKSSVAAVGASRDDASQLADGTGYSDSDTTMDCCLTVNGLRFPAIPIPPGATVTSATLQLVADADDTAPTSITILGQKALNPPRFNAPPSANDVVTRRAVAPTAAQVPWSNVADWIAGDRYSSPNLRTIVQEIIDQGGWSTNDALVLLMEGTGSRVARTYDAGVMNAAQLFLEWVEAPVANGPQTIGLRFEDVRIPQHMGIKSAVIEFRPREDAAAPANLRVRAEASGDSAPFTATPNNLTNIAVRPRTPSSVLWNPPAAEWKTNVAQQTTDLTKIVQEVVDRGDWCGGNAMTFFIDAVGGLTGPRIAISADGDASRAAILRIDFDKTQPPGPGQGCTIQEIPARPSLETDDANQVIGSIVNTANDFLQMEANVENGLRFQGLDIPRGVEITGAEIVFKAASTSPASASADPLNITFEGHSTASAEAFSNTTDNDVIGRTDRTSAVTWSSVPAWADGETYTSPDLRTIVQEIVNRTDWKSGNDLAILMRSSGTGKRNAIARKRSGADAPLLRVRMKANIGDLPSIPVTTVRQRLKQIVNELDANGYTPIVDTLYESAVYYRGENVKWGLDRGNGNGTVKRSTRVSHPSSYLGGTVVREAGCTDINLDASACISEHIEDDPTYISPINTQCQANFIVMLTDGIANRNSSKQLIRDITGDSSCDTTLQGGGGVSSSEQCGLELTRYLKNPDNDQNPSIGGNNTVITYTIGLEISNQWLKDLATEGGGKFFKAGSTEELRRTFNDIVSDVLSRTSSFATPSISVNAFNRLAHLDEVYLSLFEPQLQVAWPGNVKKYKVCQRASDGCKPGELLDTTPPPIGPNDAVDDNGRILDSARSAWTSFADGSAVLRGGASEQLPNNSVRRIYTFTGDFEPVNVDLVADDHQIADVDNDGILDGIAGATADERLQNTKDLLGWPGAFDLSVSAERAELVTQLNQHINWIRGQDVDDEDLDGNRTEDRYGFGDPLYNSYGFADPLHSSPVAFTIGGETELPVVKFVVGTNDGAIHLVNGINGKEEFLFYPPSLLPQLVQLRKNPNGQHLYGVDGTASVWLNDVNNDGVIASGDGDFARVFIGMRRGGNEIIALDITPTKTTGLEAADREKLDSINPVYNWRIKGGSGEFPRLGQTWSRPQLATVALGNWPATGVVSRATMLLFAGGYDQSQDSGFGPGGLGNAIYMANPVNGKRMLSISTNDPTTGEPDDSPDKVVLPPATPGAATMNFPIPSELALLDTTGDGAVNRIVVGDTGGQLWRADLFANNVAAPVNTHVRAVIGMLATVSGDSDLADQRKFFEPPDVIQVRGGQGISSIANFEQVNIVSGNRAHPLDLNVQDRFFAFRDVVIGNLSDDGVASPTHAVPSGVAGDGIADGFTTYLGALDNPSRDGDLFDVTDITDPEGTDLAKLQAANGYYLDFVDSGEKGLSTPVTLGGKLFFTTYLPESVVNVDACSLAEGESIIYAINVLDGSAIFNWDGSPDTDPLTIGDRKLTLGAGIPSSAVPIFTPDAVSLVVGTSSGLKTVPPGIGLPRERTFWFEERKN